MPYEHLYPDEVRELIAVAEQDESPLTLIDGTGRAFIDPSSFHDRKQRLSLIRFSLIDKCNGVW